MWCQVSNKGYWHPPAVNFTKYRVRIISVVNYDFTMSFPAVFRINLTLQHFCDKQLLVSPFQCINLYFVNFSHYGWWILRTSQMTCIKTFTDLPQICLIPPDISYSIRLMHLSTSELYSISQNINLVSIIMFMLWWNHCYCMYIPITFPHSVSKIAPISLKKHLQSVVSWTLISKLVNIE